MTDNYDKDKIKNAIKYSNCEIPPEYMNDALRSEPLYGVMLLAERYKTDDRTNCAIPSDTAVEEVRDWSIEKKV